MRGGGVSSSIGSPMRQICAIRTHWETVCDEARLADVDRLLLWRRQILNDLAFEGSEARLGDVLEGLDAG